MWILRARPTTWAVDHKQCAFGHAGTLGQLNLSASMVGWLGPLGKFGGCLVPNEIDELSKQHGGLNMLKRTCMLPDSAITRQYK